MVGSCRLAALASRKGRLAEATRRDLTDIEIEAIGRREIDERRFAATEYDRLGAIDRRDRLTAEADALAALL
ncbi:hypothetical protein ACFWBG_20740 [Nocardia salmonicida]|uniref:hypothetical protein n=1 Tax=Nocardia salmonicida TaxID=53431 RepID=UPI0036711A4B